MEEAVFLNPRRRPAVIPVISSTAATPYTEVVVGKRKRGRADEGRPAIRSRRKTPLRTPRTWRRGYNLRPLKRRPASIPLDKSNPTPAYTPVTPQQPLPSIAGVKRLREGEVVPTAQILLPKRARTYRRSQRSQRNLQVNLPVAVNGRVKRVRSTVKIRPVTETGPGVGVRTVDVEIPGSAPSPEMLQDLVDVTLPSLKPRKSVSFNPVVRVMDPSAIPLPLDPEWDNVDLVRAALPPRNRRYVRRGRKNYPPANAVMPAAIYHPTIKHPRSLPPRIVTIPKVVYHPSMTPAVASVMKRFPRRTDIVAI